MGKLKERLNEAWVAWNLETTPEIFFWVTLFGAFVFTGVMFALSALAAVGLLQESGSANAFPQVVLCVPPAVVLVLWLAYRMWWLRFKLFGTPR